MKRFLTKLVFALQAIFRRNAYACPFCNKKNYTIVFKKYGIVDIYKCRNCALFWTNPIFSMSKFYNWLYSAQGMISEIPQNNIKILRQNRFRGSDKDFHKTLEWLSNIAHGNKLLDFGSSWGYFLFQAKDYGFQGVGLEISSKRAEFGIKHLGVDIRTDFNELVNSGETFDVIFSAHTLEHTGFEIRNIIEKLLRILNKGGTMVIEVPRLQLEKGNVAFRAMGAVHPLGFTKEFFINNLSRYGLTVRVGNSYEENSPSNGLLVVMVQKK